MTTSTHRPPAAVHFGARARRGVLLGFSGPRLVALGVAAILVTAAMFTAGLAGVALVAPVAAPAVLAAFVHVAGRPAVEWAPVSMHWLWRRSSGQDRYLARPMATRPAGTLALPGDAASLRVHLDTATGAAMIHDPHRRTLTVTCAVEHPSFVLLGDAEQQRRVSGWGRVLASVARSGHIAAVQVLETSLPDRGTAVRAWWQEHGRHDGSWASRTYGQFVDAAAPASARHRTLIALSLDMKAAARAIRRAGGGVSGAAAVLRGDMDALHLAMRSAELTSLGWLGDRDLAALIRAAYDPAGADALAQADLDNDGPRLASAGPVGIREHWSWLRSDSSVSAVLWISEWPRSEAFPNFLHPIVLAPGVRKTLSIIARPLPAAQARRELRRAKVEYVSDAEQKARLGQVPDYSDGAEFADLLAREQELAHGHADLRFTGLVAITAADVDELDAAVAIVEQAALQAECETHRLVGQQSQAFAAAALPLGRGL